LQSTFTPDTLNRLTSLNNGKLVYDYTLDAVGNRQKVVEHLPNQGGRTVNWSYDNIYRLTDEVITLDPMSKNGNVHYDLDPVGNRTQESGTLSGLLPGSFTYDFDDRLNTETYDANGNTLTSGGKTFAYDFENRLKSMNNGTVTIQYDADGNRVAKTVAGVTTRYLVDDLNPTGYAQVVEEVTAGAVTRQYTYGLQRISQSQQISNALTPSYYGYDGGGTVRLLTDSTGAVTDTYDYDAWGNEVNTTGTTPNAYLYRGEQYDTDLGLYYLRARNFNPVTGRFLSTDPAEGVPTDPATLHKYLYTRSDPVNRIDPTGWADKPGTQSNTPTYAFTPLAGGYLDFFPGPLEQIHVYIRKIKDLWGSAHCPEQPCLMICARAGWEDIFPAGGMFNHVYFWDMCKSQVCGQGRQSHPVNGREPYPTIEDPHRKGTVCVPVPCSRGLEGPIMKCCHERGWPKGWRPLYNDCHNVVDDCVRSVGLDPPTHPGGRWGDRGPAPECQAGPWTGLPPILWHPF
jgi:RHS repeat-associated protein